MGGCDDQINMKNFDEAQEPFLQGLAELLSTKRQKLMPEFALTDENWDSMAVISCIALIDEHFDVTVPGNSLLACQSLHDLIATIDAARRRRGEEGSSSPAP